MSTTHTATIAFWVALSAVPRLGSARLRKLEEHFDGDLARAWAAPLRDLRASGIGGAVVQGIASARESVDPERELQRLADAGVSAINWHSSNYPRRLRETDDAPPVLYVRGELPSSEEPAVAVVGTRRPSDYGRKVTGDLCKALAANGVTVVSGLALGIDARAHQAALDAHGRTIAVLGNGLDSVYPREHARLAARIVSEGGALVSEFGLGVRPEASNFPRRNRIISGMSLGTLVTEAGETSGTRWTVYHALEQNREVFCVPGSIYTETSKLTNRLIREGAKLVTNVDDILVEIGLDKSERQIPLELDNQGAKLVKPASTELADAGSVAQTSLGDCTAADYPPPEAADPEEAEILKHITGEPIHIDDLVALSGREISHISGLLTMLELKGLVRQAGAMHYHLPN